MQEQRERLLVARLHVQHQLDVRPGHSRHTVSNPCGVRKLRMKGLSESSLRWDGLYRSFRGLRECPQVWNKCCIINRLPTPTNTSRAIRQLGSRLTSGSRSVAAT